MEFSTTRSLHFGEIELTAKCTNSEQMSIKIHNLNMTPDLPAGMSVTHVNAFLIDATTESFINEFEFSIRLSGCIPDHASPASGQDLDAQEWDVGEGTLVIGTEDGEALQRRLPWLDYDINNYPIQYLPNGLKIALAGIPSGSLFSVHFVAAYNQTVSGNNSEWFAVDIPHQTLRNARSTLIATAP